MRIITKPIVFIDTETTGLDTKKDRIVELSITKITPEGVKETKTRRFNPEMPIPASATAIHGITDEDVKDEPTFKKVAKGLHAFISGSDIVGYNVINYDAPLLFQEFKRAGINWDYSQSAIVDSCNIFKINESRDLKSAYKFYCGKVSEEFHGAEFDVSALMEVFKKQIKVYNLKDASMEELAILSNYGNGLVDIDGRFVRNPEGEIVFNFGEHKGKPCKNHKGTLEWMMTGKFTDNTKLIAEFLINSIGR